MTTGTKNCPECGDVMKISDDGNYYLCYTCRKKYKRNTGGSSQKSAQAKKPAKKAPDVPEGKTLLNAMALIMALVCAGYSLYHLIPAVISFVGSVFSFNFRRIIGNLVEVLNYAAFIPMSATMFMIFKRWSRRKAGDYVMTAYVAGMFVLLASLLRVIVEAIQGSIFGIDSIMWLVWSVGLALSSVLVLFISMCLTNQLYNPFDTENGLADAVKDSVKVVADDIIEEIEKMSAQREAKKAREEAARGPIVLKTNYGVVKLIFLSILTCGIYDLVLIHQLAHDTNITCQDDGKHTSGLLVHILLSFITCGIYAFVYPALIQSRLRNVGQNDYGLAINESGMSVFMWNFFGTFCCGIGGLMAWHIVLKNTNLINHAYNSASRKPKKSPAKAKSNNVKNCPTCGDVLQISDDGQFFLCYTCKKKYKRK